MFKKSAFMSPTIIILSDASDAFSIDQDRFLQKDMSQLEGRFVQQRKILQVGSLILIHTHLMFISSRSMRLVTCTLSEFDTYTKTPSPKLFLSLQKIGLKPLLCSFGSIMPKSVTKLIKLSIFF